MKQMQSSRVAIVVAFYIIPIPLELVSTGLRLYAKHVQGGRNRFTIDDLLIVLATICAIGECCVGLALGPPHGFGRHIETVSPQDLRQFEIGNHAVSHCYNLALGAIKLSILAFYHRVFVTPGFRRVVQATLVFVALWVLSITIVLALQCRPIAKFWDAEIPGKCFNLVAFSYFTNISNLATDLWIFFLPIPVIWGLQVYKSKKLGLCCVFLIGLCTCVISSARLSVVVAQGSNDFTWAGVPLGIMSAFEPLGGILSANLPVTYALFKRASRTAKSYRSGSGSGSDGQGVRSKSISNPTFGGGSDPRSSGKRGSGGATPGRGMYGPHDLETMTFSDFETQRGWSVCAIDVVEAATAPAAKKQPVTITTQIEIDLEEERESIGELQKR